MTNDPTQPALFGRFYTVRQTANAWNVSCRTIHRIIQRGELGVLRVGRNIRIPASEIKRWVDSQIVAVDEKVSDVNNLLKSNA